ncbi:spectrin domain with coiled-coils 1 isoform 3-like protein [Camelus ferus]|nr:spectrin domain with coiled-coils 1 isoform 3-like protein [Camelus ferus]
MRLPRAGLAPDMLAPGPRHRPGLLLARASALLQPPQQPASTSCLVLAVQRQSPFCVSRAFVQKPLHAGALFMVAAVQAPVRALEEKNRSSEEALAELQEENRALKEKLAYLEHSPHSEGAASHAGDSSCPTSITQESSCGSPAGIESTGDSDAEQRNTQGGALRTSGSSSSDVTKASFLFKSPACSAAGGSPNTASELSLASLTEKIHRMEENQHSTAEELQATLQELSDQQQMLQELTAENEKLVDEKALLETSFQQHRERAEQLSQENEKLIALLQERARGEEPGAQEGKILELEQKCTEILEQGRFEREKLLSIQQQLTCSLRKAEEEHRAALEMVKRLKEENGRLSAFLELQRRDGGAMATTLEECRAALEGLKVENGSLKAHLEKEKQSAVETGPPGQTAEGCEVQEMLRVARAEKEQLEQSCSELKQELLKARGEVKHVSSLLAKVEKDYSYLKEICDHQAEQLSRTSLELQEKASESDAEIKGMKETIFELEDQVEQHRAVKLHNNQLISNVMKLEEQKSDLERQLKALTKQIKEETEEWRRFQADLQTAVVVANDIKCEAQQELRAVKRRLLEEEEKNAQLQKELGDRRGPGSPVSTAFIGAEKVRPSPARTAATPPAGLGEQAASHSAVGSVHLWVTLTRPVKDELETAEVDAPGRWHGVYVNRTPPTSSESATTVKSLIKSFDLGRPGGAGQNISVHKTPRSPLSGIPVRTAPAAAVSPMQRHSTFSSARPASRGVTQRLDLPDLPLSDLLKGRAEDLKPDPYLRKSPSLESLSRPPSLGFGGTRLLSASPGGWKPPGKLSVERRDPLAALAREYGGSKRNALLKCSGTLTCNSDEDVGFSPKLCKVLGPPQNPDEVQPPAPTPAGGGLAASQGPVLWTVWLTPLIQSRPHGTTCRDFHWVHDDTSSSLLSTNHRVACNFLNDCEDRGQHSLGGLLVPEGTMQTLLPKD